MIDEGKMQKWLAGSTSFVLFDRRTERSALNDIPSEILDRLNGEKPFILSACLEEIDRIGIVLSHDQLAKFKKGEPILIVAEPVAHRPALQKGRRQIEGLERRVQDAHAVQTYMGVERLCEWMHAGRSNPPRVPDQRIKAMQLLATNGLPDETHIDAMEEDDRLAFYRTQCDAGSRVAVEWHPWIDNPRRILEEARKVVRMQLPDMKPPAIKAEIAKELRMNRFMLRCWQQATTLVLAEHELSEEIRKNDRVSKGQLAVLAGLRTDRVELAEAVRAAIDGDFDPSQLFRNMRSFEDLFELARILGRHGRGSDERLTGPSLKCLRKQISMRDQFEKEIEANPECGRSGQEEATLFITNAAYELFSRSKWIDALDAAIATDGTVTLTERSNRIAA